MSKIIVGFTGHRDKLAKLVQLEDIQNRYPDSIWVHGGAYGFDRQVQAFASERNIQQRAIYPDYHEFGIRAPLVRNQTIVDVCNVLVALYDGRRRGGTFYTIEYMKKQGRGDSIIYLTVYT